MMFDRHRLQALGVFRDLGVAGLRLSAESARVNADIRYRRGDLDWALHHIERALAYEWLMEQIGEKPTPPKMIRSRHIW